MSRETSRDYTRPHRPAYVRLWNGVGKLAPGSLFDPTLGVDSLMAAARRAERLDRFDDEPALRRALEPLLDALAREARLHAFGKLMTREKLLGSLRVRLRAQAWFERHPEILAAPLARPIFVTGLQRSGTTLLQRLLAQLPGARPILAWEAFEPAPELRWRPGTPRDADPRFARTLRAERWMQRLSPDLFAVHPMDAAAPEEEAVLMDHGWLSQVSEVAYHVPSFRAWYEAQDQTPAYAWLGRAMRLLAWQRDGQRLDFWVLKTPQHLEWLDVLFEVFPDAIVVQTHRDPSTTIASYCSMIGHIRGLMSDHVDPKAIGDYVFTKIGRMLDRAIEVRDARAGAGFVDVGYAELTADPLGVLARIAREAELPVTGPVVGDPGLQAWLATQSQHRHGVHRYAASDFGLDEDRLHDRFAGYRERFGLSSG
ncbi:sulfotransferase family protein [Nannocystaceae bacterium ST9]